MILKNQKTMKKVSLILIFLSLLISSNVAVLGGEKKARSCGEAFQQCMDDAPGFWMAYFGHASYCAVGYVFCKKYIED